MPHDFSWAIRFLNVISRPGYEDPRLAYLLSDLPVQIPVRLRPAPEYLHPRKGARLAGHGGEFVFKEPATWGAVDVETHTVTRLYGKATAVASAGTAHSLRGLFVWRHRSSRGTLCPPCLYGPRVANKNARSQPCVTTTPGPCGGG